MKAKTIKKNETPEPPFDIRKWLTENPPAEEIRGDPGSQYIPIGIIEQNLDRFDNWQTFDFRFAIVRIHDHWFADASVGLSVTSCYGQKDVVGAVTYPISSRDENQDHAATALSYATANAAKKLGIRFGRALNGRLTVGDTLPVIKVQKVKVDVEKERILLLINDCETTEQLGEWALLAKQYKIMTEYNKKFKKLTKK